MVKRIQRFKVKETYVSNKRFNYTLPKAPISKIIISRNTATAISCTGGSYTANTVFEFIQLRINGKMFIDFAGDSVADAVPWAQQLWREFYLQTHKVSMPAEIFIIELPDALPKDAQLDLIIKCRDVTSVGTCTSALVYTWDINFEMEDIVKGKVLIPFIIPDKFDFGTKDKDQIEYVPAMPYKLRAILFCVEDNNSLSATVISRITIEDATRIYFEGSLLELEGLQEGRSGKALTTGHYIFTFMGGLKVAPQSLKLTFYIPSASTDIEVQLLYISY